MPAVKAQRNADWGVSGGVTTYIGDLNRGDLLHLPGPAGAIFYRYNLHPRQAIRASLMAGRLSGDDALADNDFQLVRNHSFSGYTGEMAVMFEFNFFPYTTDSRSISYTPYIAGGIAVSFIDTEVFTNTPVIPLSAGFKFNFRRNLGLEIEYGFRKTFYDNFDGLVTPIHQDERMWTHNNDWYTFAGISFTWKMYSRFTDCPAYW